MSKPQPFPDVIRPLKLIDLGLRLGALVPDNSITIAIAVGLESGQIKDTIAMLQDQIRDNRSLMQTVLPEDLLIYIENF